MWPIRSSDRFFARATPGAISSAIPSTADTMTLRMTTSSSLTARSYSRSGARGRHDPLRGEPDPARPAGPRARCDRDAAPAVRPRPLARAALGPHGDLRRRPRQAPLPALRGRARDPLAPAYDRHVARARHRLV